MKKLVSIILAVAIFSSMSAFAMSTAEFNNGMRKGIDYFNKGMYHEARDEFQWFCDANWGKMNDGQQKYALDYLGGAKQKMEETARSAYDKKSYVLSQSEFDAGMRNGIDYFNKGMYNEARDEFQWFCDAHWSKMNDGQRKYALDYLGGAKARIKDWESHFYEHSIVPSFSYFSNKTYSYNRAGNMDTYKYTYDVLDDYYWFDESYAYDVINQYEKEMEAYINFVLSQGWEAVDMGETNSSTMILLAKGDNFFRIRVSSNYTKIVVEVIVKDDYVK